MSDSAKKASTKGAAATIAIVLVTSLFFVWGLAMNLVSSLNAPIANYLELTTTQTSLMQVAYYGAYFVMPSRPAPSPRSSATRVASSPASPCS